MSELIPAVEAALTAKFGTPVVVRRRVPLAGGSINRTERLDTNAGSFVLKSHSRAPRGFFEVEALGLATLRRSGTSLSIPDVVAVGGDATAFVVLELLEEGSRRPDFDERLGIGLAGLHRFRAARFGFDADGFCGATDQPNPWTDQWVEFYANTRLGYQVRLARARGALPSSEATRFERLISRISTWIAEPADGPSLIHGDLWSGNLHVTADGRPALLDPAAYYAHREAELGMMLWFGGFSPRVYAAYDAAYPLEPGWRERNPLYRLYHVLNHVNLFGAGYLDEALAILRRFE